MNLENTYLQMKEMGLSRMAHTLDNCLQNGEHSDLTHEQLIALIVEEEYVTRKNRKLQRMIAQARFYPELPALEDLVYRSSRGFTQKDIVQFKTTGWIHHAHNIIITGPTGCGKSFLAQAIALNACKMGMPAMNIRYKMLFEELNAAKGVGMYLKHLKKLSKIKVLIIDDFLMHDATAADLSSFMDVIEEKQQRGSIIITTQYPISTWHKKMPDPTIADAICDRLVRIAYKFNLEGESMRKIKQNLI